MYFLAGCDQGSYGSECEKVCGRCQDKTCNRGDGACGRWKLNLHFKLKKLRCVIYHNDPSWTDWFGLTV